MNEVSTVYDAYITCLLVPPAVLALDHLLLGRSLGNVKAALLSSVVISIAIIGTSTLHDHRLHRELAPFDLDGDGIFSGAEVTSKQEEALLRVTGDVGRTLAPPIGGAFAAGYSAAFFGLVTAATRLRGRFHGAA